MFCSFKVELKSRVETFLEEDLIPPKPTKYRTEWEHVVDSAAAQWIRTQPHVPTARNVGGTCKKKWTPLEDQVLDAAVGQFGLDNWRRVAIVVPGRSSKQCRERWLGHMAPDNTKEEWSAKEDMILIERQAMMGHQWAHIKAFLPGRSLVSVKNRWNWICRRDVPNHHQEFEEIVRSHGRSEEPISHPGESMLLDFGPDSQREDWSFGPLF
jgi:hypothetical protein